jgi:hypothetical protein
MRAIILALVLMTGCASTGGRASGGIATMSVGVAAVALVSSVCLGTTPTDDCNRTGAHDVMIGSLLVGVAALAAMVGFEMNHATAQRAQANVQY